MNGGPLSLFWPYAVFVILLLFAGIYCLFGTLNLIRALIGVELLIKAVTLLIICAGFVTRHTGLAQALVITFIVIEVVVMAVALGIVVNIEAHNKTLDVRRIKSVK